MAEASFGGAKRQHAALTPKGFTEVVTLDALVSSFRALGLGEHDLLVHSSFKSLGPVEGGPETVVEALVQVVAAEHTLLFPAHTWVLALDEGVIHVDSRETPVMQIGIIPEIARRRDDSVRSLHATHSVTAFGKDAQWYVEGHEKAKTPCGEGSPYWKLGERGGQILLLGCDHSSNTCMHQIEEVLNLPTMLEEVDREAVLVDRSGVEHRVRTRMHSFLPRNFMRFDSAFTELGIQTVGKVGEAKCRLIDAKKMREFLLEVCRRDPQGLCRAEAWQPA
jgi:aminoglycoside 3-N-acetyltransferase